MNFLAFLMLSPVLIAAGFAVLWYYVSGGQYRWETATMEPFKGGDQMITVQDRGGKLHRFVGDCTVWHAYPSGGRPGTLMESQLSDAWTRLKWKATETRRA